MQNESKNVNSMYTADKSLHRFFKHHPEFTTEDPEQADLYLIMVYLAAIAFKNASSAMATSLQQAVGVIDAQYPYWRTRRARHMTVITHDWSRCALSISDVKVGGFEDVLVLTHQGELRKENMYAKCFSKEHDIVIPPIARRASDPALHRMFNLHRLPVSLLPRKHLAFFSGTVWQDPRYSMGVRQELMRLYRHDKDVRIVNRNEPGSENLPYVQPMRTSRFCLCPGGWQPWSPRAYMAIIVGCVPVFFWPRDAVRLPWDDTLDYSEFAVFVPTSLGNLSGVATLKSRLLAVGDLQYQRMLQRLAEVRQFFMWPDDGGYSGVMLKLIPALGERVRRMRR